MLQTGLTGWPYPIRYDVENEDAADLLVLGGGMAGCMAAITAVRRGLKPDKVVVVDKAGIKHSGATGAGNDHWHYCINPASPISAEEITEERRRTWGGYFNALSHYISVREAYDALLELERMGAKIRDTEDVFKGAEFRDEKTKLLFAGDYVNKYEIRVWGTTFKPALYRELKRLGIKIYEWVLATSLLTEGGKQGARVVGATGVNVRTGEFYTFKAKATILCLAYPASQGWTLGVGHANYGHGHSMGWRAGAELTMMEKSRTARGAAVAGGGGFNTSWYACSMVDAEGKEIPWVDRDGRILKTVSDRYKPAPGQKIFFPPEGPAALHAADIYYEHRRPGPIPDLNKRIEKGEFKLPLYANLPGMPEHERRAIYGLMIGQEGGSWLHYHNMARAGFDPDKHLLQVYEDPGQEGFGHRRLKGGGLVVDWDLKTNLEGLYATGDQIFDANFSSHAVATGRYAARKAVEYISKAAEPIITQSQLEAEKARIYAPVKRKGGMEWKELNSGLAKVMQHYCGDTKSEERMKIGLRWLDEMSQKEAQTTYARNPHELMRVLDVFSLITVCQTIMHQCLARKASCAWLEFKRLDYPEDDPPEWRKWITIKQENGEVKVGELPIDYWGDLKGNY